MPKLAVILPKFVLFSGFGFKSNLINELRLSAREFSLLLNEMGYARELKR